LRRTKTKERTKSPRGKRWTRPSQRALGRLITSVLAANLQACRIEAILFRTEAAYFAFLFQKRQYLQAGYSSLGDLAVGELEVPPSTASDRLTLHRALTASPLIEKALLQGRLTPCQARTLAPIAHEDPITVTDWIEQATEMPVRELNRRLREIKPEVKLEEQYCTLTMTGPTQFQSIWGQAREFVQKLLGFDVPDSVWLDAVLSEAGFRGAAAALEQAMAAQEQDSEAQGQEPAAAGDSVREATSDADTPAKVFQLVSIHPEKIERAKAVLSDLKEYLREVRKLIEPGEPADAWDAIGRLKQIQILHRPIRMLRGRLLCSLCETRALLYLGWGRFEHFAEHLLGLSPRSAQSLLDELDLFENWPELEEAYARGEIGITKAFLVARVADRETVDRFILRAGELTHPQFLREVRFLDLLRKLDVGLGARFTGPLPQEGLEEALVERLRRRGSTEVEIVQGLTERGIPIDVATGLSGLGGASEPGGTGVPDTSRTPTTKADPAEKASGMDLLEALLDCLVQKTYDRLDEEPPRPLDNLPLRVPQTFGAKMRVRIRIRLPRDLRADFETAISTIRDRINPLLPTWLAFCVLFSHVYRVWSVQDPLRIPTEAAILARDRYHCQFPGCTMRWGLHVHHIDPLSQCGPNTPDNKITLCFIHHQLVIHAGYAQVFGKAPDDLTWEVGIRRDQPPMRLYHGQRLIQSEI